MDIAVEIEGVPERTIADAIRKTVHLLCRHIVRPGEWRLSIGPSENRGEWDLGILAPSSKWQVASFAVPVERLPDVISRTLRMHLDLPTSAVTTAP